MKLPIIRQFYQTNSQEELETAIRVLENFSEFRGVSDEELDVTGELLTNMYGAIDVHKSVKEGLSEKEALNNFAKKVMGSIDR